MCLCEFGIWIHSAKPQQLAPHMCCALSVFVMFRNSPFKSCQPGSAGLINPMTIQWELTIEVHSGLCECWQGDTKSQFLMELQIHHGCKKVIRKKKKNSSQQFLELFRPVKQSEWKDRLLLQEGYKLMQFRLNYLFVCLSGSFPPSLSCLLFPFITS